MFAKLAPPTFRGGVCLCVGAGSLKLSTTPTTQVTLSLIVPLELEVKVDGFIYNMFKFHLHGAISCDNPIATKLVNMTTETILMVNKKEYSEV